MRAIALDAGDVVPLAGEALVLFDDGAASPGDWKKLVERLRGLGIGSGPTLLVVAERGEALERAARNVPWLEVETPAHASVYQIMRNDRVIFEKAALLALEEALRA